MLLTTINSSHKTNVLECVHAGMLQLMLSGRGVARIFEWGTSAEGARSEAPKVPRGYGAGRGCAPSPEKF